jgi:hypothetical protein
MQFGWVRRVGFALGAARLATRTCRIGPSSGPRPARGVVPPPRPPRAGIGAPPLIALYADGIVRQDVARSDQGIGDIIMSLNGIIFVRRQSPDWGRLAHDYRAGMPIDPSRYKPRSKVPGFPDDIVACIEAWNETFAVDFFRCRQMLKEISERSLHQIRKATIISEDGLDQLPTMIGGHQVLLFFFDDDDWFAPDTFERLSVLDLGQCDIAVFPLVRFGMDSFTFVRSGEAARVIVGTRRNFGHRFQTNNYGISSRIALSGHLPHLQDHVLGSVYADQENLRDTYFDLPISATNKTPCSANAIGGLRSDPPEYRAFVRRYVENLRRLQIPRKLEWMTGPLRETLDLFIDI